MLFAVLASLAVAAPAAGPPVLDLQTVLEHARPAPELLSVEAELAAAARELTRSRGLLLDGATVSAEAGPRSTPAGDDGDVALGVDLPLASDREERRAALDAYERAGLDLTSAARVESTLALKLAYVDAWEAGEALALVRREVDAAEGWLTVVQARVAAGAEAAYEASLVAAEAENARLALATARERAQLTWAELRLRSDVGASPSTLAEPTQPLQASQPSPPAQPSQPAQAAPSNPASGVLMQGSRSRAELELALVRLAAAREASRWALGAVLAREGEEDVARLGVGYRIPLSGQNDARRVAREAALSERERRAEVDVARLEGRLAGAREVASGLGVDSRIGPAEIERALAALDARLAAGRDRPSQTLPLRRQLVNSLGTAVAARAARLRAAFEIEALTTESLQ